MKLKDPENVFFLPLLPLVVALCYFLVAGCSGSPRYDIQFNKNVYVGATSGATPGPIHDVDNVTVTYTTESETSITEQIKAAQELAATLKVAP